jgi:hypothetical protein
VKLCLAQGAKRPDRLNLPAGIMRSLTSTNSRPYRHFGGVALHNRALRIIGERGEDAEDHLAGRRGRVNGGTVAGQHLNTHASRGQLVHRVDQVT